MTAHRSFAQLAGTAASHRRCPSAQSSGFTLVELLMVIAICNILLCLLFPAVQAVREGGRRLECANHLKQVGLAWQMHHTAHLHLPTGGWGWGWVGDPDRGYDEQQPGAWAYNILPFIEEEHVHSIGTGMSDSEKRTANVQLLSSLIPLFNCPSRRSVALYPNASGVRIVNCASLTSVFRGDYSASVGNPQQPIDPAHCDLKAATYSQCNSGPPSFAAADNGTWTQWAAPTLLNGVSFQRSTISLRMVTDGTSHTAMVGEGYMNSLQYDTGRFGSDNESVYAGFDDDLFKTTGFGPQQDNASNSDLYRFGSAHSGAFNMAFCDGSVRHVNYEIDNGVFAALGSRAGGEVIEASLDSP